MTQSISPNKGWRVTFAGIGINLALGVLYTMSGCRKRDYPQNIFYQQPWWHLNHLQ